MLADPERTISTFREMMERKERGSEMLKQRGGSARIAADLGVDTQQGLGEEEVGQRRASFGENKLEDADPLSYCDILKDALSDPMMVLLMVLGVVAIVINETFPEQGETEVHHSTAWIDGGMILVAVTLVTLVTTVNDYSKELKFRALDEKTSKVDVKVARGGSTVTVDQSELVVGDILLLNPGDVVPADGLLIAGDGVSCDESACTGENDPWKKVVDTYEPGEHRDPFLISGTNVISASGARVLVVAVGENSFSGILEKQTQAAIGKKLPTPLQEKLEDLADLVGNIGIAVSLTLFLCCSAIVMQRWAVKGTPPVGRDFLNWAIIGVSLVVVAVPEGLPLAVTIALAYSMQAMMEENNMVRSLSACETMGAATSICSDKTGTLTTNQMTTVAVCFGLGASGRNVAEGADWERDGEIDLAQKVCGDAVTQLGHAICFNSTATDKEGNKTEQGLMRWVCHLKTLPGSGFGKVEELRGKVEQSGTQRRVFPFSSINKSMTTIVHNAFGKGRTRQYTKGASEIVLECCTKYIDPEKGSEKSLSGQDKKAIEQQISAYAKQGWRTLGIATAEHRKMPETEDAPLSDLTWLGLCALQDPPRKQVPGAVRSCLKAGVSVRMCTGDNLQTAKAIAQQCNLVEEGDESVAMEGPEFREQFRRSKADFYDMLPKLRVLARCSPLDKQLLVGSLMMIGETVAVTGDGTNDAPALAMADVGFAMDDGTSVAKKACKIILLDNNFVSVVRAVKWGRNVNDSIRKFLQFQFTVNIVLLVITFVGTVGNVANDNDGEPPLTSIQLLWANLIMDTLAALALSTEKPHEDADGHSNLLDRPPTYRSAPLIGRKMWRFIGCGVAFQLAVMTFLMYTKPGLTDTAYFDKGESKVISEAEHQTVVFNTFIFMQIFNWFCARKLYDEINMFEGFSRSPYFLPIVAVCALVQWVMVQFGAALLGTAPLDAHLWGFSLLLAILGWVVGTIGRLVKCEEAPPVIEPPGEGKREAIEQVFADVSKGDVSSPGPAPDVSIALAKFKGAARVVGWASRRGRYRQGRLACALEPAAAETPLLVGLRTPLTVSGLLPHHASWAGTQ
eukprot:TRINITY_DN714_c0_g3_i1.p1 TRINITY_DN714_c0_g3~~TRINITY_DN714_c0_g3_i1.p1  ORF type:complete len:1121 (+),score=414.98 TRINITY_DN714_c0_g3_i1:131-3364(+)